MPEQQIQDPQGLTSDESAAALGFITTLSQHAMGMGQDASQSSETAPEQAQQPEPPKDLTPEIEDLKTQLNDLKVEVAKSIKEEIGGIKDMIASALNDNEQA